MLQNDSFPNMYLHGVLVNFGYILSKKVEFWKSFTFQAPLEIQDPIE